MIEQIIHKIDEESGKEKHVPYIQVNNNIVTIKCGKDIMHPSLENHYIVWMKLYGEDLKGNIRELGSANPTPVLAQPVISFQIELKEFKRLIAVIYCNIHGIWQNEKII